MLLNMMLGMSTLSFFCCLLLQVRIALWSYSVWVAKRCTWPGSIDLTKPVRVRVTSATDRFDFVDRDHVDVMLLDALGMHLSCSSAVCRVRNNQPNIAPSRNLKLTRN